MKTTLRCLVPAMALALWACGPAPVAPGPGGDGLSTPPTGPSLPPSSTPDPSATASAPVASVAPSATPSASPSPQGFLAEGTLFRRYDWLGLGRPFYDRGTNRLYVADAVERKATDRRFQLLRFDGSSGDFLGNQSLKPTEPTGLEAPARLEAVAFDRRGVPLACHVDKDDRLRLMEALSATVRPVADFQVTEVPRIGSVSMVSDGIVMTQILLRRDDDKNITGNLRILLTQSERNQQPLALVNFENPLRQVLLMAASVTGVGHVVGLRADGKPVIARVQGAQPQFTEVAVLARAPEGLFADLDGSPLLVHHAASQPARLERLNASGQVAAQTELRLSGGGYLTSVVGLCPDGQGGVFVTGQGLDAAAKPIEGLYRFPKPTP